MARSLPLRRALAAAAPLVVAAGISAPVAVGADPSASPVPGASADPRAGFPEIQIWQDLALPPNPPPGRTINVGFTAWDATGAILARVAGAQVRVHPKAGSGKPANAFTRQDWPGHLVAPITVPDRGLGTIEVGFTGQECHDDTGQCTEVFLPFAWGGIGPPPDAPRSLLVAARIQPPIETILAGQPFEVAAEVTPRADWDPDQLALPDRVVVIARQVRGPELGTSELQMSPSGAYTGSMTIADPGDAVLVVAVPGTGSFNDPIEASTIRIRVGEAESPAPSALGPGDAPIGDSLPVVPTVLVIVAVLGGGLFVRRVFSDL